MNVSAQVKALRLARGMGVADLARASGISAAYLHQIESGRRGNPSGEKLQRLATALGVTIPELIRAKEGVTAHALEEAPESLRGFVRRRGKALGVRAEDVEMLKRVHYRGRRPRDAGDWELIYVFLRRILDG